jgi:hypothetical protein
LEGGRKKRSRPEAVRQAKRGRVKMATVVSLSDEINKLMAEYEAAMAVMSSIGRRLAEVAGRVRHEFEFVVHNVEAEMSGDEEEEEEWEDE